MGREGGRRQEGRGECWRGERRSEGGGKRGIEEGEGGGGAYACLCKTSGKERERKEREREREREKST